MPEFLLFIYIAVALLSPLLIGIDDGTNNDNNIVSDSNDMFTVFGKAIVWPAFVIFIALYWFGVFISSYLPKRN